MIGGIIAKARKAKKLSKTELSEMTNINIGHLTHIEKEERNPSHKALKSICDALEIPVQPLMYTYDKNLTQEQIEYNVVDHIKYNYIPVFDSLSGFSKCPVSMNSATFILKVHDDSMAPKIKSSSSVFVEMNAPLAHKDIGLFEYNNELLIRKFIIRKKDLVLRAESNDVEDIIITKDSDFYIIGKILGTSSK